MQSFFGSLSTMAHWTYAAHCTSIRLRPIHLAFIHECALDNKKEYSAVRMQLATWTDTRPIEWDWRQIKNYNSRVLVYNLRAHRRTTEARSLSKAEEYTRIYRESVYWKVKGTSYMSTEIILRRRNGHVIQVERDFRLEVLDVWSGQIWYRVIQL